MAGKTLAGAYSCQVPFAAGRLRPSRFRLGVVLVPLGVLGLESCSVNDNVHTITRSKFSVDSITLIMAYTLLFAFPYSLYEVVPRGGRQYLKASPDHRLTPNSDDDAWTL